MELVVITSFEDLQTYEDRFAPFIADYFVWNFTARYNYMPDLFERNATGQGTSLQQMLEPFEQMRVSRRMSEAFVERKKKSFENGEWLVLAVENEEIAGTARLTHRRETETELHSVYVAPEYRGRGIGQIILRKLQEIAQEKRYEVILLETMPFMEAAVKLYEAVGFEHVDFIDFGYPSRDFADEIGVIYMEYHPNRH